jgi:MFS family permease
MRHMTTDALAVGTFDADAISTQRKRVGWSAFLGTVIEYYDFTLYGLLGPVVFDKIFFPKTDPTVATLVVLSFYAVGFVGRPLGGLFFAHYGDKIGRRPMMVIAMTVMGLASTAMGLLPTYASVGILAPFFLVALRILQGFALGGESAGANVLSTEVGPQGRRGYYVSLVTSGIFLAWILALGASTGVSLLSQDDLLAWGWRLPFVASILLVGVGIWMRLKVEESAVFVKAIQLKAPAKVPFLELMRVGKRPFFIVLFAAMAESTTGFFYLVFGFTYALRTLHIAVTTLLTAMLIANIMALILAPVFGTLSDRYGRRRILSAAYAFSALYTALFFFPLLESGSTPLIYLAMIIPIGIGSPWAIGVIGSFYSEQFSDARLRYSGVGVGRGLGTSLGGGLMPLVAASLMAVTNGSRIGPIVWFDIICIGAIIAILLARETKDERLA